MSKSGSVFLSAISISAIEVVGTLEIEQQIRFGIESLIGLLTVVYLVIKIYNQLKQKNNDTKID